MNNLKFDEQRQTTGFRYTAQTSLRELIATLSNQRSESRTSTGRFDELVFSIFGPLNRMCYANKDDE